MYNSDQLVDLDWSKCAHGANVSVAIRLFLLALVPLLTQRYLSFVVSVAPARPGDSLKWFATSLLKQHKTRWLRLELDQRTFPWRIFCPIIVFLSYDVEC